jgi:hypothetical protein
LKYKSPPECKELGFVFSASSLNGSRTQNWINSTFDNSNPSLGVVTTDPQCLYNLYNNNGIPVKTNDKSLYKPDPLDIKSQSDPIIDNVQNLFNNYTSNQNSISNINNILTPLDAENSEYNNQTSQTINTLFNQYKNTITDKSNRIKDISNDINNRIGIEKFENENNNNMYKNISKFLILFIIILLIWYIIIMINK